ncbi:MAG: PIN domain-containing protein [Spirochaetota bacterium]
MPEGTYVDTNVILRFLLADDETLSEKASRLLSAEHGRPWITGIEIVAELVYVLSRVYEVPRSEIADTLHELFTPEQWKSEDKACLLEALALYGRSALDIIDCWLIALHRINGVRILTFDTQVRRFTT